MIKNYEELSTTAKAAEELERFRRWYSMDSKVYLTETNGLTEKDEPLRDALCDKRLEALGGDKYFYDFTEAMDYPLEEYVMTFGDMITLAKDQTDTTDTDENSLD